MELERVSDAALISLKLLSKVRSSLNEARREFISAVLAPGALLRIKTFASDVFESATASCRVSMPVKNRLTPAIDTLEGKVAPRFNPVVRSASRPPHPVWLTTLAIDVCTHPTCSE